MATPTETLWKDRKHFMWWPLSFQRYEVRNDRLYQSNGFFTTTLDELLLYRITDLTMKQTLLQRLFGTGTILLSTRGDSSSIVKLENIKNPRAVRDFLSQEVERSRIRSNVVGREFYGHSHTNEELEEGEHTAPPPPPAEG
jgi:uncharacterized membrane protein YdbT with pleckstrin-like domain